MTLIGCEKASFGKPDRKLSCQWTHYPNYKQLIFNHLRKQQ